MDELDEDVIYHGVVADDGIHHGVAVFDMPGMPSMVVFLAASLLWPRADMVFLQFVFCLRVLLDPTLAVAPLGMSDVSC